MITFRPGVKYDKQATVRFFDSHQVRSKNFTFKNKEVQNAVISVIEAHQFSGDKDQFFPVIVKKKLFLLVGLGKKSDLTPTAFRISVRNTLRSHFLKKVKDLEIIAHEQNDETIKNIIEGIMIGTYVWNKHKSKTADDYHIDQKKIFLVARSKKLFDDAIKICAGTNFARDLINDNADTVTSGYLEKTVRGMIKGKKNITLEILNEKEMKAKGLRLHLAVNQGSNNDPKLVIVKYQGAGAKAPYTAIIGKGMTFDTGGLNLKPTGHMETMRLDMSGSAAVIGTLKNTLALGLKKNVIFAVALAENVTGSKSYKPGEVIKSYSGKTVEIANTDAEGRLVLADALSYIGKNYKPARMIDIATLTGACIVALGLDYAGLVTSDDKFSRQLVRSSNETDDRIWRLPVYPELKQALKSHIADISNLGTPRTAAGMITAAEFLHQFAEDIPWAHLDIAGTSFVEEEGRMYYGHGATGFGVRLLTNFLQRNG